MTTGESIQSLHGLRGQVLDNLGNMADQLANTSDMGFDALLAIARTTGKPELLSKAFELVQKMPDSSEKAESMLDLLDEIEVRLAVLTQPEQPVEQSQVVNESQPDNYQG
jgi:hypothetical protein